MSFAPLAVILLLVTSCSHRPAQDAPPAAAATRPARVDLFDASRHMRISEVKPGMKGYGLSVFLGTRVERFEVEVVSVLRNFNTRRDVVLVKCSGMKLEHSGAIAGMSGSPIYLLDDKGNARLIGAFAYGWPWSKDPLVGIQPIEYMLELANVHPTTTENAGAGASGRPETRTTWTLKESGLLAGAHLSPPGSSNHTASARLTPLLTPLMSSGISRKVLTDFEPALSSMGLVPMQAGATSGRSANDAVAIEPGSVLAAPVLLGDSELIAIGTATEVIRDYVFGFGHPFNNEGAIRMPFASGEVTGIVATLNQSFKIGAVRELKGTLTADQSVGVAGRFGESPSMIPVEVVVDFADGSPTEKFDFQVVRHPRLTPVITMIAVSSAVSSTRDLPETHTVEYSLELNFENNRTVRVRDVVSTSSASSNPVISNVLSGVMLPIRAGLENPFQAVPLKSLKGNVRIVPEARDARIVSANLPRQQYKKGELVRAFVTYRPFRQPEAVMPIDFRLPADLPPGTYQLVISDWDRYLADEMSSQPSKFVAESIDELFGVIDHLASQRHDRLYVRLIKQADGVSVGPVAMPSLPSSRRHIFLTAGRSNTTPLVSSVKLEIPTKLIFTGHADLTLVVGDRPVAATTTE